MADSRSTIGWRHAAELSATERLDVLDLLNRIADELNREALDESRLRTVVHGWPGDHWLQYRHRHLVAYALVTGQPPTVELAGGGFDADLLARLFERAPVVEWWTRNGAGERAGAGVVERTLHLLEITLPVPPESIPPGIVMRPFEPGQDDEAWLEQNNLAFAHHPEQGAWRRDDLRMRIAEPWFDPSGFLLLSDGDRIVASCWTKVHELNPDRFGEIYVISVHPEFQGRGLGLVAVTQGLAALRRKGVSRAVLFVDDTNTGARALYERLGFRTVRRDHLVRFVAP